MDKLSIERLRYDAYPENTFTGKQAQSLFDRWFDGVFKDARPVYGYMGANQIVTDWTLEKGIDDTHKALLINVQPIKRGVAKTELLAELQDAADGSDTGFRRSRLLSLKERIEKEGIRD